MQSRLAAVTALLLALAGCVDGQTPAQEPEAVGPDGRTEADGHASATDAPSPRPRPSPSPSPAPKDTDKDGASDKAEKENGTDPKDPTDVPYVLPSVPVVDAGDLLTDLATFASTFNDRSSNGPDHLGARDWLATTFASSGLEVWRHSFTGDGLDQENLVGIRWGLDRNAWVVGAHYDTTTTAGFDRGQSQGAYDDGSGTMMMVHLAKAFANLTMPYTLVFAAFDGEERGLEGSRALVGDVATQETPYPGAQIVGAVDLDMFGLNWPGTGAPMVFLTNSVPLRDAVEAARLEQGVPDEGILYDSGIALGSSDYQSFFEHGIATGFFLSDFEALGAPFGLPASTPQGVYPFWHLSDTMQTMTLMAGDAEHLRMGFQAGVDLAASLVHHIGSTPGPIEAGTSAV